MEIAGLALALSVLWPQPRQTELAPDVAWRLPVRIEAPAEVSAPAELLRRELTDLFGPDAVDKDGDALVSLRLTPDALPRPEEYALDPSASSVSLTAHDTQGMFWAVHALAALLSRARAVPGGYEVTVPKIRDWPDTPFRAFMIQGAWTPGGDEFKRNLELLARQHVTYVALEFGPQVVLDCDPSMARGGRFTKQQAKDIIDYGRSLGLKPIAYLNMLGHLERAYQKEPYTLHGGIDIRSDEAYEKFVYPILSEMLEVYGPVEFFHCGMDEAWELFEWLSKEGYDVKALIARHITRVNDFLKARGVKTVIWHDMLIAPDLRKELGAPVGPANGGPPQNTAGALAMIPKDVILDYWFYDPLQSYPALDYLQKQGFTMWSSPWQTPFSLVRYSAQRNVPVLGTLWSGPPGCFASPQFSPVTAYYAQAVWDSSAAPRTVNPEPELNAAAQHATSSVLWRRRSVAFPGKAALLLSPVGARRVEWPAADVPQCYGVPLDPEHPVSIEPLPTSSKPLSEDAGAVAVSLPGGVRLDLDGVNTARGANQLVLYTAPREKAGTNIYGTEASVSATGEVLEVTGYGSGDGAIPAGGFILSAHLGDNAPKARRIQALRSGDRVAVLNAAAEWVGGSAPSQLLVELPGGETLRIDGEDCGRDADCLVLYHAGYGDGSTGANEFGVEVVVSEGKVREVRTTQGNAPIPEDGYVLSAHSGDTHLKADALRNLGVGDAVALWVEKAGQRHPLLEALAGRRQVLSIGSRLNTLYLAMSTQSTSSPGTPLGEWVVQYADGTREHIPVRYGREATAPSADALPQRTGDPIWLAETPNLRCIVREWPNPHPEQPVQQLTFEPALAVLELGARIEAVTAAAE